MLMKMRGQNKYSVLLKDPQIGRWAGNMASGSPIIAEVALRRLGRLGELLALSPGDIVAKAKKDVAGFQDLLEDVVSRLESEHSARSSKRLSNCQFSKALTHALEILSGR